MKDLKNRLASAHHFTRKYMTEILSVIAMTLAILSSWAHLFIGTTETCLLGLGFGLLIAILFPTRADWFIQKAYSFSKNKQKFLELLTELVKVSIALFIPVLYFVFMGLLAGAAYHYYTRSYTQMN